MSKETEKKTTRTRKSAPKTSTKVIVAEGTGDPRTSPGGANTVTVTDKYGNEVEVNTGEDGKSPVSPNNPPKNATLGS